MQQEEQAWPGDLLVALEPPYPKGNDDLGGQWDTRVLTAIRRFVQLPPDKRADIRTLMTLDDAWVLLGWAEGMASLSIRRHDLELVVLGMVAMSLTTDAVPDIRDALVVLLLLGAAAVDLHDGLPGVAVVAARRAAALTDQEGADLLLSNEALRTVRLPSTHMRRGSGETFEYARAN